ncbi:MAG: hypothetical protein J7M38_13665 [Armatimonadetes bacterium]|nr:hypothetical protein [Armatimonadota bacterium]
MPRSVSDTDFIRVLERWPVSAERYWWDDPERPELGCFGSGYNAWGVQTNQKALGALAVLATHPDYDESVSGVGRDRLLEMALRALRYSCASHVSGDHHCSDGTQWGHTWISALGIERMMHGVSAISEQMTEDDHAALRRVLVSEADALLDLDVTATKWNAGWGNRPESNIWNGALLYRTCMMYPDEVNVGEWLEKAHIFLINGISIEADAADDTSIAGKPVRLRHIGANYFPHYALDHHGYLNVGYMVICLSNIAMLHFACREQGWPAPEDLYWHAADLWDLVRRLIFADGRLCRIGGDTRQRYDYCQDYLLPALAWAADYLGEPHAPELEAGALQLVRAEQEANGDGSFLSQRLATIRDVNPYYYTRLEADKAVVLSMNAWWHRALEIAPPPPERSYLEDSRGRWVEPEHGAIFVRSPRRMASWSWRAAEPPQGLCLPPVSGHLAEWCANMGGTIRLLGETGKPKVERHDQRLFEGGFLTVGAMQDNTQCNMPEGWTCKGHLPHQYAVAALPDDRSMIVLEYATVPIRSYLAEVKGLKLNVPDDLFNGYERSYYAEDGEVRLRGDAEEGVIALQSLWVNVEDVIGAVGIYGSEGFSIYQAGRRRASGFGDSLYYDELCFPCHVGTRALDPGVVLDCGSVVLSGADRRETAELAMGNVSGLACAPEACRAVRVRGADGADYALAANFSGQRTTVAVNFSLRFSRAEDLVTGEVHELAEGVLEVELDAGDAVALRIS